MLATLGEEMEGPKWRWGDCGRAHGFCCSQNHGYRIALNIHTEASFQNPYELPESTQPFSLTVTHSQAAPFCLGTESLNLNRQPASRDSRSISMGARARNRAAQWPEIRVWYSRLEEKLVSQTGHNLQT